VVAGGVGQERSVEDTAGTTCTFFKFTNIENKEDTAAGGYNLYLPAFSGDRETG
jgi:hypothetical protein